MSDPTSGDRAMRDLRERLAEKAELLRAMAEAEEGLAEAFRLKGKAQGVDLALSFVGEYLRAAGPRSKEAPEAPEWARSMDRPDPEIVDVCHRLAYGEPRPRTNRPAPEAVGEAQRDG